MSTMLRKKWRLLKIFLCFKMLTKSLKILWTLIGKKTVSEILYVTGRNFLLQKETSCHRKKLPVRRRDLMFREETSCHRKKPPVTVRNLLSQEATSCRTKKLEMFICFKMLTKALRMIWTLIGKKTVKMETGTL
jgi:hypothetical protein